MRTLGPGGRGAADQVHVEPVIVQRDFRVGRDRAHGSVEARVDSCLAGPHDPVASQGLGVEGCGGRPGVVCRPTEAAPAHPTHGWRLREVGVGLGQAPVLVQTDPGVRPDRVRAGQRVESGAVQVVRVVARAVGHPEALVLHGGRVHPEGDVALGVPGSHAIPEADVHGVPAAVAHAVLGEVAQAVRRPLPDGQVGGGSAAPGIHEAPAPEPAVLLLHPEVDPPVVVPGGERRRGGVERHREGEVVGAARLHGVGHLGVVASVEHDRPQSLRAVLPRRSTSGARQVVAKRPDVVRRPLGRVVPHEDEVVVGLPRQHGSRTPDIHGPAVDEAERPTHRGCAVAALLQDDRAVVEPFVVGSIRLEGPDPGSFGGRTLASRRTLEHAESLRDLHRDLELEAPPALVVIGGAWEARVVEVAA